MLHLGHKYLKLSVKFGAEKVSESMAWLVVVNLYNNSFGSLLGSMC